MYVAQVPKGMLFQVAEVNTGAPDSSVARRDNVYFLIATVQSDVVSSNKC